jgi:hypothetical protein
VTSESARLVDFESGHSGLYKIAVLVPCCNEEKSIAKVVEDFRTALPTAAILVYDNNSTDNTASVARTAGAEVFYEKRQGKGSVVRRMFADVDADIYVLVDGDATYDAPSVRPMIGRLLENRLDMVVGTRIDREQTSYRTGHRIGNKLFTAFVARVFDSKLNDVLSGYRVLSRRFVKSFPVLSGGFEIETELTIHALELGLAMDEVDTPYYKRAEGSLSKLKTWSDGFRILLTIANLFRAERPLPFFACIGFALAATSIGLAIPIVVTFLETGLVPRLPTAVLSTGLMLLAFLAAAVGLILDTVTRGRRELKLLAYLSQHAHEPESLKMQTPNEPRYKAAAGLKGSGGRPAF